MEKHCENCLFYELDTNIEPCASCPRTDYNKWLNSIEHTAEGYEMQSAILKTQLYILRELSYLKDRLDKLEPGQLRMVLNWKE